VADHHLKRAFSAASRRQREAKPAASKLRDDAIDIPESIIDAYNSNLPPRLRCPPRGEDGLPAGGALRRCHRPENFPLRKRIPAYLNRLIFLL
jgi:hypothetical protein